MASSWRSNMASQRTINYSHGLQLIWGPLSKEITTAIAGCYVITISVDLQLAPRTRTHTHTHPVCSGAPQSDFDLDIVKEQAKVVWKEHKKVFIYLLVRWAR